MLQEGRKVGAIILEIDRPYKLPLQSEALELWNNGIPRGGIAPGIDTEQIFFVAIFVIHQVIAEDMVHVIDNA